MLDLKKLSLVPLGKVTDKLKKVLVPVKKKSWSKINESISRVLADDVIAKLDNPPFDNSAIDGYAIKYEKGCQKQTFKILGSISAPGKPFKRAIKKNEAVRILTGAQIPRGSNRVVFDEEVSIKENKFTISIKKNESSNIRVRGEDIKKGQLLFKKGYSVAETDMPSLIASGNSILATYSRLRVGLLKTGNEIKEEKISRSSAFILDTNGMPLTALFKKWGYETVQLGNVNDSLDKIRERLSEDLDSVDVIVTTGGASAGKEDFISQLLLMEGKIYSWKIAIKPGRPMIFGKWNGKYIFGLPGNPVAAFVCTLIFLRSSLGRIAGEKLWFEPISFKVPSAFTKTKRVGRTEFLRARLEKNNTVSVFPYEGSGRLTSLAWSNGLVKLEDEISSVSIGDEVSFIPYSSFY